MLFPAHIRQSKEGKEEIQTVEQHCHGCAEWSSIKAGEALRNTAYLAGLLHDMGKYTNAFRDYITRAARGEEVVRGSVNHTFAGVRFVMERWHTDVEQSYRNMTAELIAVAIGGHHGLFDCIDPQGVDGFVHRMTKDLPEYQDAVRRHLAHCSSEQQLKLPIPLTLVMPCCRLSPHGESGLKYAVSGSSTYSIKCLSPHGESGLK